MGEPSGDVQSPDFLICHCRFPMAFTQSPIPVKKGQRAPSETASPFPEPAPDRSRGEGPFNTLLITDVTLISGEGRRPEEPVTIVVEGDRIAAIQSTVPSISGARIIDGGGMYALPGFIDAHTHLGNTGQGLTGPITPPEYIFKLWMAHGITTVREVGSGMGLDWTISHRERSNRGEITAPRLLVHAMFPGGQSRPQRCKPAMREVHRRGADGVKLRGAARRRQQRFMQRQPSWA